TGRNDDRFAGVETARGRDRGYGDDEGGDPAGRGTGSGSPPAGAGCGSGGRRSRVPVPLRVKQTAQAARSFSRHVGSSARRRCTRWATGGCVTNNAARPVS